MEAGIFGIALRVGLIPADKGHGGAGGDPGAGLDIANPEGLVRDRRRAYVVGGVGDLVAPDADELVGPPRDEEAEAIGSAAVRSGKCRDILHARDGRAVNGRSRRQAVAADRPVLIGAHRGAVLIGVENGPEAKRGRPVFQLSTALRDKGGVEPRVPIAAAILRPDESIHLEKRRVDGRQRIGARGLGVQRRGLAIMGRPDVEQIIGVPDAIRLEPDNQVIEQRLAGVRRLDRHGGEVGLGVSVITAGHYRPSKNASRRGSHQAVSPLNTASVAVR